MEDRGVEGLLIFLVEKNRGDRISGTAFCSACLEPATQRSAAIVTKIGIRVTSLTEGCRLRTAAGAPRIRVDHCGQESGERRACYNSMTGGCAPHPTASLSS
eukprot:scaffold10096_cov231-Isochrysis_galbana.AAC.1